MKGYCENCGVLLDETEIDAHEDFWIDGNFLRWWSPYVWFCPERDLYVPKSQTIKKTDTRIYINPSFARGQISKRKHSILRNNNKIDLHLIAWVKALNTPYIKDTPIKNMEEYELP